MESSDTNDIPAPVLAGPLRVGLLLAALALVVRGSVCFLSLASYAGDPDAYRAIAESLSATGVYGLVAADGQAVPTAFRPPLYPFVLSWLVDGGRLPAASVAVLHTLLGTLTVVLTFLAARRMLGPAAGDRGSILAALLVLVDPILLQQSTEVMTETLATALVAGLFWWWADSIRNWTMPRLAILSILLSLSYLCRPTFLVWGGLLCAGWLVAAIRTPDRRVGLRFLCLTGLFLASVGLWTMRNARTIGHPVWATTHGGYTLLLGNNPSFYDYLKRGAWGQVWDSTSFQRAYQHRFDGDPTSEAFWRRDWTEASAIERGEVVGISEQDDDRLAYEAAKATIRREPGWFVWSCVVRVLRLWSPIPHMTAERSWAIAVAVAVWYVAIYVAVMIGVSKLWRRANVRWDLWWPIAALLFTLTAVHAVYWSNMRMRAPAIPALALVAAAAMIPKSVEPSDVADR